MDYRVIFGIFLAVLAVHTAPTDETSVGAEKISHGPLFLSDEDKEALLRATQQATKLNKANPGEQTHGILEDLLASADAATNVLERLMGSVQNHEEKSHNAIENLRSHAPDTTDICVRGVFGTPTRTSPMYCGVKYFSQVAIGLYDMAHTVAPLKQTVQKLAADLAECKKSVGLKDKFICNSQAYRNGWENSEYLRSRLGQHLTVIRFLAIEISDCITSNHEIQAHLVNQVADCTRANK